MADNNLISAKGKLLGAKPSQEENSASLAMIIPVLPMVPHYVLFWEAEPADGFDARVKILFDEHVMDFLDLESLVFAAERLADRFKYLLEEL
jgi:hypothetical protein